MAANVLPISVYEDLLPKLVAVLELTQQLEGITTPQAKQKLLHATNDFKNLIAQAKDFAINLPGGELVIEEQDDVINMLEMLKERKRAQLSEFAARNVASQASGLDMKMEVDSMASTPFHRDE
ncbi:hypothetical protein B0H34DRAFT_793064 [Crassisporium funariophilum]|nr:hypothetical protein B0H34DRAFT_793064 [Crassisporium funariophilum]